MHRLGNPCLEMHLNPAKRRIKQSDVPPGAEIEIGAKFTIYAPENVDVKSSSNAERIVISGFKRGRWFEKIDTDQQPIGFRMQAGEKEFGFLRGKISD